MPPGNINVTDSQGEQTLMAKGQVASTFSDYSGNVGTLYNVPKSSSVVNKVEYVPTPGATGPAANLSNPDGIGIPKQAKYPKAAAKFIQWFTSEPSSRSTSPASTARPRRGRATRCPSHLSAVKTMAAKGNLVGGDMLSSMLAKSKPVFPGGAPAWYPQFSNAVYTNLHAAADGFEDGRAGDQGIAKRDERARERIVNSSSLQDDTEQSPAVAPRTARPTVGRPRSRKLVEQSLPYLLVSPLAMFIIGLALVPAAFTIIESFYRVNPLDPPTRFDGLGNFRRLFANDAVPHEHRQHRVLRRRRRRAIDRARHHLRRRAAHAVPRPRRAHRCPHPAVGAARGRRGHLVDGHLRPEQRPAQRACSRPCTSSGHSPVLLGENRLLTIVLIELVQVWQITPLSALLILAAMQVVPDELYEAAEIDGCSIWASFWRITLPLARPGIAVAMVQALIATLNVFDQPYVLNGAATTGSSITSRPTSSASRTSTSVRATRCRC